MTPNRSEIVGSNPIGTAIRACSQVGNGTRLIILRCDSSSLSGPTKFNKYNMTRIILILLFISKLSFGITPTVVREADKVLYAQYLVYCNKMVKDTVLMVGTKTIPLIHESFATDKVYKNPDGTIVVRKAGNYLTQTRVLNTTKYSNRLRLKTYKNVPKIVTAIFIVPYNKEICWVPIHYKCKQRKPSIKDFYEWYYPLKIKPI